MRFAASARSRARDRAMLGRLLLVIAAALPPAASAQAAPARPGAFEPEATVRRVDRVSTLAVARAGSRLVVAGERGRILVSDDRGTHWKVVATPTHNTLTSVMFVD